MSYFTFPGVIPEQFGAVGNGTTNDTAAFQTAAATGKSIFCRSGANYLIGGSINFTANGQWLYGNGCTFTAAGTGYFDAFRFASPGKHGGGLRDLTYEGGSQTSGRMIVIAGADRTTIENIRVHNPYNAIYAEKTNLVHMRNAWVNNVRGAYGIQWYGDASKRSDVFEMLGVTISSGAARADGILWGGNCHTMTGHSVRLIGCGHGLRAYAVGGTSPAFGKFHDLEVDFPHLDGISLEAGSDYEFANIYSHGSANGAGLKVSAAIPHGRVTVQGGKITDNATFGIDNAVEVLAQNLVMHNNASGDFAGPSKVSFDNTFYTALVGGDPYLNFDANDYLSYSRAANAFSMSINSTNRLRLSNAADAVEIYVNGALKTVQVGAADSGGTGYRMLRVTN